MAIAKYSDCPLLGPLDLKDYGFEFCHLATLHRKLQLERMADQTQVGKLQVEDHADPQKTEGQSNQGKTKNGKKNKKSKIKAKQEENS